MSISAAPSECSVKELEPEPAPYSCFVGHYCCRARDPPCVRLRLTALRNFETPGALRLAPGATRARTFRYGLRGAASRASLVSRLAAVLRVSPSLAAASFPAPRLLSSNATRAAGAAASGGAGAPGALLGAAGVAVDAAEAGGSAAARRRRLKRRRHSRPGSSASG